MIRDAAAQSRAGAHNQAHDFRYYLGQVYVHVESYLIASAYTVLVFLVRLLVLTSTLPLFLMAAFVGLVDGVGASRRAQVRRVARIGLRLSPVPWRASRCR